MPHLVLASSSRYRQALLGKLGLPFAAAAPDIDESPLPGETPRALVERLAAAKARALATRFPHHLIIGSDQVACLDDRVLGKPGTEAAAREQLRLASGRSVEFLTGLCLLDSASGIERTLTEPFRVHFRTLTETQIARYVEREQPLDCAGSFKSEGLGIALFERLEGNDPNALIGLPLIRLTHLLEQAGVAVL
jgi:MAF protein